MKEDLKDRFNCFVEVDIDIEKAGKDTPGTEYDKMYLQGVGSTDDEDSDEETLDPDGYVIDEFKNAGTINYEHLSKQSPKFMIGDVVDVKIKDRKLFLKGKLWKGCKVAEDLWDTLKVMKANGSKKRLGWSIEGKALERDPMNPKKITKALITGIAATFSPKNKNTWADVVKGEYEDPYIEVVPDVEENGGTTYLLDVTRPDGTRITIDKDLNIKVEKAMTAGSQTGSELIGKETNGASLKKESLSNKLYLLPTSKKEIIKRVAEKKRKGELDGEKLEKALKIVKSILY